MPLQTTLAELLIRPFGYRFVFDGPVPRQGAVFLGAPHTSNWDFAAMLAIAWRAGIPLRWLGKAQMFRGPLGPILRRLGGVPVDREAPGGTAVALAVTGDVRADMDVLRDFYAGKTGIRPGRESVVRISLED